MSLRDRLITRIRSDGPISVADYMSDCLLHPDYGYYATGDPFGTGGDFITAPEISQMFGEMIGLALAQVWLDQGQPNRFALVELGPGRGTFMADILRAVRSVPGFLNAAEIWLVEASPVLQQAQAKTLAGHTPAWVDQTADLPDLPLLLVANEFFDALPIRQFVRDGAGWRERRIGLAEDGFTFGLAQRQAQPALAHRLDDTRDGDIVEHCLAAAPVLRDIGTRIAKNGGGALILDYGDWRSLGDTFQALRKHAPADPLDAPGTADLTAHVDFEALAMAASCAYTRLTPQGVFLERLGITARAQALAAHAGDVAQDRIVTEHRRLTHPDEMGNLFKVLGLYPENGTPPPGLTA